MTTVQAFILMLYVLRTNLAQQSCDDGSISEINLRKDACNLKPISVTAASGHLRIDDLNCNIPIDYTQFSDQPLVMFLDAQEDSTYTLAVVDPDVPGVPKGNYFLHWLVADIKGCSMRILNNLHPNYCLHVLSACLFMKNLKHLGDSYRTVLNRLSLLVRRLAQPILQQAYSHFTNEFEDLNHMKQVEDAYLGFRH